MRHLEDKLAPLLERGLSTSTADGCWVWTGATNGRYGVCSVGGRRHYVHRAAWKLANGTDVPAGMFVCHSCDNPLCFNPRHLWIGTQRENIRDCMAKGRKTPPPHFYGPSHHHGRRLACAYGHTFTPENTHWRSDGGRKCRTCEALRTERRRIDRRLQREQYHASP